MSTEVKTESKNHTREYVVLERVIDPNTNDSSYKIIDRKAVGTSDRTAIASVIGDREGTFVAVPRFVERTVTAKQVTKREWS